MVRRATGASYPAVSDRTVLSSEIPLPPLPEQRRIADILDRADDLKARRLNTIQQLVNLEASIYHDLIGDLIGNHHSWPQTNLESVVNFCTGRLDANAAVENGEFPFFTCAREDLRIDRYEFDCEALLLAGNNASAEYSVKRYKGKFNAYQRTYVITLRDESNSYEYMRMALEQSLQELKRISKGTNTKYLTLGLLKKVSILAPPREIQLEYESKIKKIRGRRDVLIASRELLDSLFSALQLKAFRGEL
jgi:type I restriction enzyme S subunit